MSFACRFILCSVLLLSGVALRAEHDGKLQILLLGDSTTEGSVPRRLQPDGPHLETVLEQLLAVEEGLPPCHVINSSQSGEFIRRLLDGGRYQKNGADHPGIDYIFIRYGLNDRAKLDNFLEEFPRDFHELIATLRSDHPGATIIPSTVIPFANEEASSEINELIREVAEKEKLDLFDIYPGYAKALEKGRNMLNYRRYSLEKIPKEYHEFVQPRVFSGSVEVMGNEWDALFGHLPGWYGDRHPNLAGYNVIAAETAKYLIPLIRKRSGKAIEVALIGDSTVTDSAGWGRAFADRFNDEVVVRNFSAGGRSAKSWLAEGRLEEVLEIKPEYALIQFGHNGQPGKGPERETDPSSTFREFLRTYIRELKGKGTKPILVSSLTRRDFDSSGNIRLVRNAGEKCTLPLLDWAKAAGEVASEMQVPFVDLYTASVELHNQMGPEASESFGPKEGDITHLNEEGAGAIADLVIKELKLSVPELTRFLR